MKNLSLSMQIWLVFGAITLFISILLSLLFPWILRDFFTKEIYANIESAQQMLNKYATIDELLKNPWETSFSSRQLENIRTVNHFIVLEEEAMAYSLPADFLNKIKQQMREQTLNSKRYSGQIDDKKIFYVITKVLWENNSFLVSYMWDTYREDLVQTLFKRLVLIMSMVLLVSWIPALALARYLSNPLVVLEKRVKKLAVRDWHEPVLLNRKDEIGRLGQTINYLRKQLISQDEVQQSFLQYISHELKTPVMIIRSYTQAIKDGIYPKGKLEDTIRVIEEEGCRLEKYVQNLLYLTKLEYLSSNNFFSGYIDMESLIKNVVERMRWLRKEINWSLDLSHVNVRGDNEQWRVVLENIFDNQVRYAKNRINISLKLPDFRTNVALLIIWNDGPPIEQEIIDDIFNKFQRGFKGEFGLGLAIAHRIITLHNANIWVKNENEGVSFYVEIPSEVYEYNLL